MSGFLTCAGFAMSDHYTYRVTWSGEDRMHIGTCIEFPSLSWLAETPDAALAGIRTVVADVLSDMQKSGEKTPEPLMEKTTADDLSYACRRKYTGSWPCMPPNRA